MSNDENYLIKKYDIDKERLKYYYDELISLEDWIPFHIDMYLPVEVSLKLGSKAKNKNLRAERLWKHKIHNETYDWNSLYDIYNWEDDRFIEKYPMFTPLFIRVDQVFVPEKKPFFNKLKDSLLWCWDFISDFFILILLLITHPFYLLSDKFFNKFNFSIFKYIDSKIFYYKLRKFKSKKK
jgi:hypothetical protein